VTTPDSHPHGGCSGQRPPCQRETPPGDTRRVSFSPFPPPLSLSCPSLLFSLSRARSRFWFWFASSSRGCLLADLGGCLFCWNFYRRVFFLSSFRSFLCRRMHTQTDFWALKESVVLFGFRAPPLPRRRRRPPPHVCSTRSRTPK